MEREKMINIQGETLNLTFGSPFGIKEYDLFLKAKRLPESSLSYNYELDEYQIQTHSRYADLLGLEEIKTVSKYSKFPEFFFEHQKAIVQLAVDAKRYAVWANVGLGKTLIELEFARQVVHLTDGRVLIFTLNEIVPQFIEEKQKFYGDEFKFIRLNSREEMRQWCKGEFKPAVKIAITNYEKMNPDEQGQEVSELKYLSGIILDESSRLKAGGGKQKWALIKSSKGIPYKLSATATPAPNDYIEFASQASFLERMRDENEIIWTFFQKDKNTQEWTVKRHARSAFFEWMCAWSIYLKTPQAYGWSSDFQLPPEPKIIYHEIDATLEQVEKASLFNLNTKNQPSLFVTQSQGVVGRAKLSQIAKGFVYLDGKQKIHRIDSAKPAFIANLIKKEVSGGLQVLVWTIFDEESEIISEILGEAAERRKDLKRRLELVKQDYHQTERQMFSELGSGVINPKYTATIQANAAQKKEFDYILNTYSEAIIRLESELEHLNKSNPDNFAEGQDFAVLSGSTSKEKRVEILENFRKGEVPVLISKASLLGYGMNFQMCGSMIFSGWNDSFESFYQAVGRAVRYGQEKSVNVHLPFIRELEYEQLENIFRKRGLFESAIAEQEKSYIKAMQRMKLL